MTARIIDGKAVAAEFLARLEGRVGRCLAASVTPTLAVVLVGSDPASQIYVRSKEAKAASVGIATRDHRMPDTTSTDALVGLVQELNRDREVDGILVQLPLPRGVDERQVLLTIDPAKDIDGFHPDNLGRLVIGSPRFVACTPQGCMLLLRAAGVDPAGKRAIVIGRSTIVGKPMLHLLLQADATVTCAHSRTRDLPALVAEADIVVAAVGRARLVQGAWLKAGAAVIDVGMNRDAEGKLCGDVDYAGALERAGAITPVPGGVGPMTIACLLHNTLQAADSCGRNRSLQERLRAV